MDIKPPLKRALPTNYYYTNWGDLWKSLTFIYRCLFVYIVDVV